MKTWPRIFYRGLELTLFMATMGNLPLETLFGFCLTGVCQIYPSVAKERGLQRQGIKGEDVIFYFEPLITPHLKSSRFPNGLKNMTE
jgi:hypothetical protein